ncbi:TerD family protein [Methylorubrum extorquens]|uniref:TerD family protein n=1 Tax=Methylorubrum TaxID=2282523 RepID=UPI003F5A596A|nr:tellurium resistance protein TerD [Methylorubrum zatmanii]MCP1553726.1 tellurium resistance protein TerD [Methylorubrum extorquens]MCP1558565.1 tellurium resistance protein TerD [Methylorubrum extorquens]MCP1579962.1 tellurium resistance protein TerD [Methylorubrum extorquens]
MSLSKGGNVSLSKEEPNLSKILIGLGWDNRKTDGKDFDLDASLFMLSDAGRCSNDAGFIFYNNKESADGSVKHHGDNRTGEGDGDDEKISVVLGKVGSDVQRLAVTVTIHEASERGQNFGQVQNAFIRVVNEDTGREIARYDLGEDYSTETAMVFGEIYRHGGEWKFKAIGQGYAGGLKAMATQYGINVG